MRPTGVLQRIFRPRGSTAGVGMFRRHGHEEAARRLWIVRVAQIAFRQVEVGRCSRRGCDGRRQAPCLGRDKSGRLRKFGLDRRTPRPECRCPGTFSKRCPISPNPVTSVIACAPPASQPKASADGIQGLHAFDRCCKVIGIDVSALLCGGDNAHAKGFGQKQDVTRLGRRVLLKLRQRHTPCDRQAKNRLRTIDAVPSLPRECLPLHKCSSSTWPATSSLSLSMGQPKMAIATSGVPPIA